MIERRRIHASLLLAGAALGLLALPCPAEAQPSDPADLLPAGTLAYLEVSNPAQLSYELSALMQGSALENFPAVVGRFRARAGAEAAPFWMMEELILLNLFLSPESVAEAGRVQGAAVALTGFSKEKEPEVVGIVLSGQSQAPTFFLRMYLTVDAQVRIIEEVEGIPLYAQQRNFAPAPPGGQLPPGGTTAGPVLALLPGAVVMGSTPEVVKQVVRRARHKTAEPTLTNVSRFKESAPLRNRPGLFAYADLGALTTQVDEALQESNSWVIRDWAIFKALVNPRSLRGLTASLSMRNGGLDLHARLDLDPDQASPLLEVFPDQKAPLEMLHFVPRDALAALTLAWPDGEKRWDRVLALADGVARAEGELEVSLPSKVLAGLEAKAGLRLGKDILGKVAGLTLALPAREHLIRGGEPLPLLVVNSTDAETARSLEDLIPKLVGLILGGPPPRPAAEEVQGQTIRLLGGPGMLGPMPLVYGRQGDTLVLGLDRAQVAGALASGGRKEGLLTVPEVKAQLGAWEAPVITGVGGSDQLLLTLLQALAPPRVEAVPAGALKGRAAAETTSTRLLREFAQTLKPLAPYALALVRTPDQLTLEARTPALRPVATRAIDLMIEYRLEQLTQRNAPQIGGGGLPPPPPPLPPPPPVPPPPKDGAPR